MRILKSAGDMQNLTAQIRRGAEQIKRQAGKGLVLGLCLGFLFTGGIRAYADGPAGPASDGAALSAEAAKETQAEGPGKHLEAEAAEAAGGTAAGESTEEAVKESQQAQPKGQTDTETQTSGTEGQAESAEEKAEDGRIMSGGRWIDPSKPMIALTYDDGPYAPVGNRIMDCMEKYNGRATFFVVGNRVGSYQDEMRRMQTSGHEVGNHSYSHKYLQKLGAADIRKEIEMANQAVAAVTGTAPALVRLPGGGSNATVLANIHQPIILWNVDTRDWATKNADQTVAAVLGKVKDGDIVLMHELYKPTADAAERLIPALAEQGFQLVTVSELIRFRGGAAPGTLYYKFPPK